MPSSTLFYNDAVLINKKFIGFILLLQLIIFFLAIFLPFKISLAIILGSGALLFILFFPSPLVATLVLSLFIAIVLPQSTGRRFIFKAEEILPLFALLFFIFSFLQGDYNRTGVGKIGYWLAGFLAVVFIATIIGLFKVRDKILIWDEMLMYLGWGMFFLVVKSKLTEKHIKYIFWTIVISGFLVSLYYIYSFQIRGGEGRIATDQQHIFNFSIPVLFAILLYDTRKIKKILAVLMMVPMVIAVYMTLTRSLWVIVPLTLFSQYLYYIKDSIRRTKLMLYLLPIIIIVVIALLGIMLLRGVPGVSNMLGSRFSTFGTLEYDLSLLSRAELAQYVFNKVRATPFLGTGFGDFLRYKYFPTTGLFNIYWLDNTYLQVLWKTGIVGLTLFLGFLVVFLKRARFVLKNSTTIFEKIIGSSIFFSILALAIIGLQSGILVGYRFNFVWATLMGIIVLKAKGLEQSQKILTQ